MSKRRRFHVSSLAERTAGEQLEFSSSEARHVRVLRLAPGAEVELFDEGGQAWRGEIGSTPGTVILREPLAAAAPALQSSGKIPRVLLATALPKGKRAAILVEKCTELGIAGFIPLRCARSVVSKAPDSVGFSRLKRIAAQAAKQAGRVDVPELAGEQTFSQTVAEASEKWVGVLLDPKSPTPLGQILARPEGMELLKSKPLLLLVGPEGGFTREEIGLAESAGIQRACLTPYVLRVETAAIAACALALATLYKPWQTIVLPTH